MRGSTELTKDLLERGLNPASHFSMNLHEPVKRMLEHYGAAKVFIEGDAIILAIYEHDSTRMTGKCVARACVLAREILAVTNHYNSRVKSSGLPPLELGIGVAFQDSAPALWMDGDSKIMISKALNLSDRFSSCSKMAKRVFERESVAVQFVSSAGHDGRGRRRRRRNSAGALQPERHRDKRRRFSEAFEAKSLCRP